MRAPLSLGLITLGEPTLERAVASVRDHVKQIVMVYTGHDEQTFERVAKLADVCEWHHCAEDEFDFAEVRNCSLALATEGAYTWMDSDDTIIGAENFGRMVAALRPNERVMCDYNYWHDPDTGACILRQHRERLVLNDGSFEWRHPVHEGLVHKQGKSIEIHNGWATWVHHRTDGISSHRRNLKILERYEEKHGASTWLHYQLGNALADLGEPERAAEHFRSYLAESGRSDEKALACMRMVTLMGGMGAIANGIHWVGEALKCEPDYFDALLAMARLKLVSAIDRSGNKGLAQESLEWCAKALAAPTTTILPTSPQNRAEVYECMAYCYEHLGDTDARVEALQKAVDAQPENPRHRLMLRQAVGFSPKPGCLDIAFACGHTVEPWNPNRSAVTGIGGSETAVMEIAKRLAAKGHRVRVFTSCGTEGLYDGVEYLEPPHLTELEEVDVFVAWRLATLLEQAPAKVKLIDVHDIEIHRASPYRLSCADRIMAKSEWHKGWLLEAYGKMGIEPTRVMVVGNGCEFERFDASVARVPHRAVYSSSADRGLELLLDLWPRIRAAVPDAELHVFYGRGYLTVEYAAKIEGALKATEGVVDHGRVNQRELAQHMLSAGAWLHPSWHTPTDQPWNETFCIGAIEAAAAGLHIVCGDWGALHETARGTRIGGKANTPEWQEAFVRETVRALTRGDDDVRAKKAAAVREKYSWDGVAEKWEAVMFELVGVEEAAQ